MTNLAVNIDHIATLREARGGTEPEPITGALLAELAGAVGIVCHLREDRRHINDRDLRLLRDVIHSKLDLEMAATEEMLSIAIDIVPDLVTFVPEKREELTTEGGLNVADNIHYFTNATAIMREHGIEVSFFIEPNELQIEAAATVGADIVELHTGIYSNAINAAERDFELRRLLEAAEIATEAGLRVTAGHGLDYRNVRPICQIPNMEEISIGHAIIARAVFVGMDQAVRQMIAAMRG
ncbi:MAG: pyridoxine 5'-phosphate synthase [Ignavibacteria bacterium]|nr:pyridoxine 5'-phosphate synthase [Ignavibacteria bacterium]